MSENELPNGSIQALSTAATGTLALEIAFVGYWGFGTHSGSVDWNWISSTAMVCLAVAFFFLAKAPYLVTACEMDKTKLQAARTSYRRGIIFLGLGLAFALLSSTCPWSSVGWPCGAQRDCAVSLDHSQPQLPNGS